MNQQKGIKINKRALKMSLIEMGELVGLGAHLKEHTINFIWEK